MIRLQSGIRVYLASSPIDGRKAINGLSACVMDAFNQKLMDGSVFVFYNHARNRTWYLFREFPSVITLLQLMYLEALKFSFALG